MSKSTSKSRTYIPGWVSKTYTIFAIVLVPWTVYLAYSLPRKHVARDYDTAWVVFDITIILLLLLTGYFAFIKSKYIVITATVVASFLLVDAWFDVTSSRSGSEFQLAIILAVVFEIPLALVGLFLAYWELKNNFKS